jgi:high-affinity Fe2+/Pb2+ permease
LFLAGALLIIFCYRHPERQLWFGVGLGLVLQMLVLFIMDHNAAKRAEQYWFYIKTMR